MARLTNSALNPTEAESEELYKAFSVLIQNMKEESISATLEEEAVREILRKIAKEWEPPNKVFKRLLYFERNLLG